MAKWKDKEGPEKLGTVIGLVLVVFAVLIVFAGLWKVLMAVVGF
jgi:uncharacterized membrane protein